MKGRSKKNVQLATLMTRSYLRSLTFKWFSRSMGVFGWFEQDFGSFDWFLGGLVGFWVVWVVFGWFGWIRILEWTSFNKVKPSSQGQSRSKAGQGLELQNIHEHDSWLGYRYTYEDTTEKAVVVVLHFFTFTQCFDLGPNQQMKRRRKLLKSVKNSAHISSVLWITFWPLFIEAWDSIQTIMESTSNEKKILLRHWSEN